MAIATLTIALQAQIAEFQADFKKAAKSTEQFQQDFEKTATKASAYGTLIARGVEIGIRAFADLASKALENADAIEDLSKKTGLSMRTIQEFQRIAAQTGTTVESWTTASYNLGVKLAKGGDSVVSAVNDLSLELGALNRLNQDEQFDKVTDALRDMDDWTEANRIGALLFGRAWKEVGGGIREDLDKLKDGTRIMTDDQVQRLADANKAWKEFGRQATIVSGELLATVLKDAERAASGWAGFLETVGRYSPAAVFAMPPSAAGALTFSFDRSLNEQAVDEQAMRDAFGRTAGAAKDAGDVVDVAMKKAKSATDAWRESVIDLRDELSGAKLRLDVQRLTEAFVDLKARNEDTPAALDRTGEAAERLRQEGALLSPELQTLAVRTQAFSEWLNKVPGQTDRWATSFDTLRTALEKPLVQLQGMDEAIAQIDLSKIGNELNFGEQGFFQWENTIDWDEQIKPAKDGLGAAFKGIAPGIINILGDALTSGASEHKWEEVGAGIGALIGGAIGAYFGGPVGQAVGAQAGGAIGGWLGSLFDATEFEKRAESWADIMVNELGAIRGRVNDLTKNLPNVIEGFVFKQEDLDHLRSQFALVGIAIDDALRSRNPDWLRDVLDEGYAKTKLLKEAMEEYGFTWENLGAAGRAFQLGDLLSDLKAKTDILIGAGIDELDVLMKQEAQYESLLLKAIATNTEIPESMRPLLQRMQELGLLTDDVTGEFIDLGQVKWATTLTEGFISVVSAIDRLTAALTGADGATTALLSLRRAGRDTARSIEDDFTGIRIPPIKVSIEYNDPGIPGKPSVPALAGGGIVRRRTLALVGEAGPEAVIPLNQLSSFGAQTGKSTVILEVDGRVLAEATVPHFPGVVRHHVRPR